MPTSPDGILTAEFDTTRNLVMLTVDGGMWPVELGVVDSITITRSSPGDGTVPVRDVVDRRAAGGWFVGSDIEAPMDTDVTYTVTGYDQYGMELGSATVSVVTTGAAWGVWLKAAGRAQLTVRVPLRTVGDQSSATQGGVYQIPDGGGAVPQFSGVDTTSTPLVLFARTTQQVAALEALLEQERTLLVQTGQPEEFRSGWWHVHSVARQNPAQVRSNVFAGRVFRLSMTRTQAPAGAGQIFTGTTYETVRQRFTTYQDVLNQNPTYLDVQLGV